MRWTTSTRVVGEHRLEALVGRGSRALGLRARALGLEPTTPATSMPSRRSASTWTTPMKPGSDDGGTRLRHGGGDCGLVAATEHVQSLRPWLARRARRELIVTGAAGGTAASVCERRRAASAGPCSRATATSREPRSSAVEPFDAADLTRGVEVEAVFDGALPSARPARRALQRRRHQRPALGDGPVDECTEEAWNAVLERT